MGEAVERVRARRAGSDSSAEPKLETTPQVAAPLQSVIELAAIRAEGRWLSACRQDAP